MNENENGAVVETATEEVTTETLTFTQEELDALLQKEGDKRVSQALKKQNAKTEAKMKEFEKLASMSAEEKYVYQLEQREKEVAEKEQQLALAEMKQEATKILAEKGLSISLVDFVVDLDAEVTNDRIATLEKAFKSSVKAEVEKRLGSNAPKKNLPTDDVFTKESLTIYQ